MTNHCKIFIITYFQGNTNQSQNEITPLSNNSISTNKVTTSTTKSPPNPDITNVGEDVEKKESLKYC